MRTAPFLIRAVALLAACAAPPGEETAAARDEAYRQGNALLDRERYREARAAFERALEADPGYAPAWTELANLHARLGRLPEAVEAYERALAADPGYARACHNLGVVRAEQYRYREALGVLENCLERRPGYAPALQTRGLVHLRLGENGPAEEAFRSALGLDSSLVKARRRLGRIRTLQRRYEEAEPLLLAAARLAPGEAASWLRLGQLYLDWNRPQQALGPLAEAVRVDSSRADGHYNLARALLSLGRREEGKAAMARFTRLGEHSRRAEQLRGGLRGAGDETEIETRLELAFHYGRMGDFDRARTQLHAVLALAPGHLETLIRLSSIYLRAGDRDRAMTLCERGLTAHPGAAETSKLYHTLGSIHLAEKRLTEARGALERAVGLDPGLAGAWNLLGYVHAVSGDLAASQAAYTRAVEADPGFAEGRFNLGNVSQLRGDLPAARRHYLGALAADPSYTRARLALGNLYVELDSLEAAAAAYRLFLRDWRGDPEGAAMARAALEKLGERP